MCSLKTKSWWVGYKTWNIIKWLCKGINWEKCTILVPLQCTATICLRHIHNHLWHMITNTCQARSFPMKSNCTRPCRRSQRGIGGQLLRLRGIILAPLLAVESTTALRAASTSTSRSSTLTSSMWSVPPPNHNRHASPLTSTTHTKSSHNKAT